MKKIYSFTVQHKRLCLYIMRYLRRSLFLNRLLLINIVKWQMTIFFVLVERKILSVSTWRLTMPSHNKVWHSFASPLSYQVKFSSYTHFLVSFYQRSFLRFFCSIGGVVLLILLAFAIFICCLRRKLPSGLPKPSICTTVKVGLKQSKHTRPFPFR